MAIDLHIHSSYSDGAYSPSELVILAEKHDVRVIALADHDTVSGIDEAAGAGSAAGVEVLSAVELSTQFKEWEDVHLLGYGIDHHDKIFLQNLDRFRKRRETRNDEIIGKVNERLLAEGRTALDIASVLAYARGSIGRPHIARVLLDRGYADSVEDAFRRYLVPCNVPKIYWPIADAIAEIHRLGGVAVLAHPTSISGEKETLWSVITALQETGLDGLEVYNNMGWPHEIEALRRIAENRGLVMTAGSDFHGIEEGLEIGRGREGMRFDNGLLIPLYERIRQMK